MVRSIDAGTFVSPAAAVAELRATIADHLADLSKPDVSRLYFPARRNVGYVVDTPLDLTGLGAITVYGDGWHSLLEFRGEGVINADGTIITMHDVHLRGRDVGKGAPKAALVMFRGPGWPSVNGSNFSNVQVDGTFAVAGIVNFGCELTSWRTVAFETSGCPGLILDSNDRYGLGRNTSSALCTNSGHRFDSCVFTRIDPTWGGESSCAMVIAGQTTNVTITHAWCGLENVAAAIDLVAYAPDAGPGAIRGNRPSDVYVSRLTIESYVTTPASAVHRIAENGVLLPDVPTVEHCNLYGAQPVYPSAANSTLTPKPR